MDLERFYKQYGIPVGLIFIKLLVTLRTGIDTYEVSNDILDVLVIDGVYLVLWLIAAYSGKGVSAMALRPFAAGGAWVLYGLMLYIAIAAGGLHGGDAAVAVSLIARVAGAVLLLYDTYDYVQALVQQRQKDHAATWRDSLRGAVSSVTYLIGALLALPMVLLLSIYRAAQDYADDNRHVPIRARVVVHAPEQYSPPQIAQHLNEIDTPIVAQLQALVNAHPKMNKTEIANELNISRTTLYKYWPQVKHNGNGHKKTLLNTRSNGQ